MVSDQKGWARSCKGQRGAKMGNEGQKNKPSKGEPSFHASTVIFFVFDVPEPVFLLARLMSWVSCSLLAAPGGDHPAYCE